MLHVTCATCSQPISVAHVYDWTEHRPTCSAVCSEKLPSVPPSPPTAHREEAVKALRTAQRKVEVASTGSELELDRLTAAGQIVGLSKGARRRKETLLEEAREFNAAGDSARYELENAVTALVGRLLALGEQQPECRDVAVEIGQNFPEDLDTLSGRLATAERVLTGRNAVALDWVNSKECRVERHEDGLHLFEGAKLVTRSERIWLRRGFIAWDSIGLVEVIEGEIKILRGSVRSLDNDLSGVDPTGLARDLPLAFGESNGTLLRWIREQRPEFQEAERPMSGGEAFTMPGCLGAGLAIVTGVVVGAFALFDLGTLAMAGCTALGGIFTVGSLLWGIARLRNRPTVAQLVNPHAPKITLVSDDGGLDPSAD